MAVAWVLTLFAAQFPKPKVDGEQDETAPLPQTLVRIPIQQTEAAQKELGVSQTAGE